MELLGDHELTPEDQADDPVLVYRNDWVTAWAGDLTYEGLVALMDEPGMADPEAGEFFSEFEREIGASIDPDFMITTTSPTPHSPRDLALAGISDSEPLANEIQRRSESNGLGDCTCLIVGWNMRMVKPRSICGGRLRCLGSWPHPAPRPYFL